MMGAGDRAVRRRDVDLSRSRPGALRGVAIGRLLVVVGTAVLLLAMLGLTVWRLPDPVALRSPGETSLELPQGEQAIWQVVDADVVSDRAGAPSSDLPTVPLADLQVVGPNGDDVPVSWTDVQLGTMGDRTVVAVAHVDLPRSGFYRVSVRTKQAVGLAIGPSAGARLVSIVRWLSVGALGGSALLIGGVLLVVLGRRRSAASPA